MKKLLYTAILSIALTACGGGGGDNPEPTPTVNTNPTTPVLTYPTNNLLCIDNTVDFVWNASSDEDGDTITYEIQVATDIAFTAIEHTLTSTSTTKTIALDKGISYYWRVKATDSQNGSSEYSSINQFYTEGIGTSNYLPFAPTLISPTLNSVIQESTVSLNWSASDVDNDALSFDVYLDTVTPPTTIISSNQTTTNYTATLNSSTNYYWKIVVKDGNSGETNGQIWSFITD